MSLLQEAVHGPVGGRALKPAGQDVFPRQGDPLLLQDGLEAGQAPDAVVIVAEAEDVHKAPVAEAQKVPRGHLPVLEGFVDHAGNVGPGDLLVHENDRDGGLH